MTERIHQIADCVLQIELQLRSLNLWSDQAVEPEKLMSTAPFSADMMAFNEWLQFVFLPQMKVILEQGGGLPLQSQITPMAELFFKSNKQAELLVQVLEKFDNLINGA